MVPVSLYMISLIIFAQIESGNSRSTYEQSGDPSIDLGEPFKTSTFLLGFVLLHLLKQNMKAPCPHISTVRTQILALDKPLKEKTHIFFI